MVASANNKFHENDIISTKNKRYRVFVSIP